MSASRSFIDVLVGKLTAYVDASSRPTSDPTTAIRTPRWVIALDPLPAHAGAAARAYVGQMSEPGGYGATRVTADAPAASRAEPEHGRSSREPLSSARRGQPRTPVVRTPAQLTAIQLLRRLGAGDIDAASTDEQLRSACRRLLRACHPDVNPAHDDAERAAVNARLRAVLRARAALALPSSTSSAAAASSRREAGASVASSAVAA